MEKRRVLLVTDSDTPEIRELCLDKNTYSLEVTRGLSEGLSALSKNEYSVIIADLRQAQDQVKLFSEAREVNFWIRTVSIAHFPMEDFLARIASFGLCLNAVAGAQAFNAGEVVLTVDKLFSRDIFGIEKYCAKDAHFSAMQVRESNKKQECIEYAVNFAKGFTQDKRVLASVQDITDELLMNAFFDAPCNEQGEYLYAQADRTRTISFTKDEAVGLHLACDGKNLIISATDCFGSLERAKLLEHLAKCVSSPDAQVEIKLGGSGVGIYNILEQVTSFVINLQYRKKTEIVCILDIATPIREVQKRYKSFHIFTAEEKIDIGESLSVERQEYGDTLRLSFYGVINESAIFGRIFETGKIKVAVNLRGVKRINSCGVREWVNALRTIPEGKKLEFSECSLAMVKQFNMIANFWAHGRIISFIAPYFCPRCNRQVEKPVVVEDHLEDLLNLKAPNFSCPVCQDVLQFDDLEDKYFQFILRQESTL